MPQVSQLDAQHAPLQSGFSDVGMQLQSAPGVSMPPPSFHLGPSPVQAQMEPPQTGGKGPLQRHLVVDPASQVPPEPGKDPVPLTTAAQQIIDQMCPEGGFKVDPDSGVVMASRDLLQHPGVPYRNGMTLADLTSTPESCRRMMAVINDDNTTTVDFRAGGPSAGPGSQVGPGPGHDGVETDANVHIDPRFQGQYRIDGEWVDVPFFLLFAHELFGHALPKMQGTHVHRGPRPAGGTAPQEVHAVAEERVIAQEHGLPERPDDYSGAARQRP